MNREIELLCKMHEGLPRQGPGSNACTEKAFGMILNIPEKPLILDVGCGSGMQTIELARLSKGHIVGIDIHPPFLRDLKSLADTKRSGNRIDIVCGSMFDMPLKEQVFDIIWSEGAMYIMGFEHGLDYFWNYLKPRGYMVLTDLTWLSDNPPEEPRMFWNKVYPAMHNREENISAIHQRGYTTCGHFILPPEAWWENYYVPLKKRLDEICENYMDDHEAMALFHEVLQEIDIYKKYSQHYGYVFYVTQKS